MFRPISPTEDMIWTPIIYHNQRVSIKNDNIRTTTPICVKKQRHNVKKALLLLAKSFEFNQSDYTVTKYFETKQVNSETKLLVNDIITSCVEIFSPLSMYTIIDNSRFIRVTFDVIPKAVFTGLYKFLTQYYTVTYTENEFEINI